MIVWQVEYYESNLISVFIKFITQNGGFFPNLLSDSIGGNV